MVQTGFHRAQGAAGDLGDLLEREIFQDAQEQNRPLGGRQFVDKREEGRLALFADQQRPRVVQLDCFGQLGCVLGRFNQQPAVPLLRPPVLQAPLMPDAEEPRGELAIVPERINVPDRIREGFLDQIQGRDRVANQIGDIGIKRPFVLLEELIPGMGVLCSSGGYQRKKRFSRKWHSQKWNGKRGKRF